PGDEAELLQPAHRVRAGGLGLLWGGIGEFCPEVGVSKQLGDPDLLQLEHVSRVHGDLLVSALDAAGRRGPTQLVKPPTSIPMLWVTQGSVVCELSPPGSAQPRARTRSAG